MSRGRRLGRWVVPGAGITLAVAAILFLIVGEAISESEGDLPLRPSRVATPPAARSPAGSRAPGGPALVPPPRQDTPPPRTPSRAPRPRATVAPADLARPLVRETPAVLEASADLVALAQARSLDERLRYVEQLVERLTSTGASDRAVRVLEGLVDAELPGDLYESETLRVHMLARLGDLPGPRVEAALAARLDPERPRPQRLVAIEMLASRPYAARGELTAIASHDHDVVVQEKARWALQRVR